VSTEKRPDLSWLPIARALRSQLSRYAQQGVQLATMLEHGWSIAELAQATDWNERTIRRRLARACREALRDRRTRICACGCERPLPRSATARRRYRDATCKKRAQRARSIPPESRRSASRRRR
jgi:hypothetical protein